MKEAYAQGLESDEDEECVGEQIKPIDVGHNIYILAHQVIRRRRQYFIGHIHMAMYSKICSLHLTHLRCLRSSGQPQCRDQIQIGRGHWLDIKLVHVI